MVPPLRLARSQARTGAAMKLGHSRTRTGAGICLTIAVSVSFRPSPSSRMSPKVWNETSGPSISILSIANRRSAGSSRKAIAARAILIGFSPGRSVPNVPWAAAAMIQGSRLACGRSTRPLSTKSESPALSSVESITRLRAVGSK